MDNYLYGNLTLDKKVTDIKAAMKETKNIRMYKRYLVILKHLEGNSNIAIAKMVSLYIMQSERTLEIIKQMD